MGFLGFIYSIDFHLVLNKGRRAKRGGGRGVMDKPDADASLCVTSRLSETAGCIGAVVDYAVDLLLFDLLTRSKTSFPSSETDV